MNSQSASGYSEMLTCIALRFMDFLLYKSRFVELFPLKYIIRILILYSNIGMGEPKEKAPALNSLSLKDTHLTGIQQQENTENENVIWSHHFHLLRRGIKSAKALIKQAFPLDLKERRRRDLSE